MRFDGLKNIYEKTRIFARTHFRILIERNFSGFFINMKKKLKSITELINKKTTKMVITGVKTLAKGPFQ